jgi:hypothetical protein
MHFLLMATLMLAPAYPINPSAQDTISPMNLHFTMGFSSPNNFAGSGPELSAKYEVRFFHPLVLRSAADLRIANVVNKSFPKGDLRTATFSLDALYYRGTDKLTGYLGVGAVYSVFGYDLTPGVQDSLSRTQNIHDVSLNPTYGVRLTLGLRFDRNYSIEVGITETRPQLEYVRRHSNNTFSVITENTRMSDVRLTVGYLWTLRGL